VATFSSIVSAFLVTEPLQVVSISRMHYFLGIYSIARI
jgi:hypothetical protein